MPVCLPMRPEGFVLVDDDVAAVLAACWRSGWTIRRANTGEHRPELIIPNGKRWGQRARLARLVTHAPPNLFPQHLNGDVLDCRRANLWLAFSRGAVAADPPAGVPSVPRGDQQAPSSECRREGLSRRPGAKSGLRGRPPAP